jgi:hypothetical protein
MDFKVGDTVVLTQDDLPWKKGEVFIIKDMNSIVAWDHKRGEQGKYIEIGVFLNKLRPATKLEKILK